MIHNIKIITQEVTAITNMAESARAVFRLKTTGVRLICHLAYKGNVHGNYIYTTYIDFWESESSSGDEIYVHVNDREKEVK